MQSYHWCFTLNNPSKNDIPQEWSDTKYVVWQLEQGESETPHLQGYVSFLKKTTLGGLKKKVNAEAHWEIAIGSAKQNTTYCTKPEGRIEGPWSKGGMLQGRRTDIQRLKKKLDAGTTLAKVSGQFFGNWLRYSKGIREYIFVNQRPRSPDETTYGLVLYGETGCGKTKSAQALAGDKAYWKPANKWWSGYSQQRVVVCDEFYGYLTPHTIQALLNHGPLIVETKGGHAQFNSKEVIFTCNNHPSTWWPNANLSLMVKKSLERRFKYFMHFTAPGVFEIEKPRFTLGVQCDKNGTPIYNY